MVVANECKDRFWDRKGQISLNIQAVVDCNMRFIDFVNRYPGSCHDARIFRSSSLYHRLENNPLPGFLLADSGYAVTSYMLTPLRNPCLPAEVLYNKSQILTRNLIERTFGCWKSKFWCLKGLRLKLSTSLNVITACAVIWNFLLDEKEKPNEEYWPDPYAEGATGASTFTHSSRADSERTRLIATHFTKESERRERTCLPAN